ncbi:coiled-coil domain-containing protein 81-like isoform X2 [Columba livia]
MAIWDAVATYIHDHLLSNKGVRIPTLGSFDVVTQQVQVGDEDVTIHRPTFNLARNLVVGHNLVDDKSYLPGNKELEPIKYSKVAATASVSRRKVEGCVQGTLSLFSYCLGKGQNVALLLKDIGVLLLEATKVDMRFYHHFLEALAGKDNLQKVVFQVPEVLDTMLSPMVPLASLCSSGRTIIFPRFAVEVVAKPRPNESQRAPGEDEEMRKESFPHLGHCEKVPGGFHGFPAPGSPNLTSDETSRIWEVTRNEKKRRTSHTRKLSVIQKVSSIPSKESMTQKVSSISSSPSKKPSMTQKVSSTPLSPSKKPSMTQKVSSISSSPSKKPSMTQKVSSTPLSPSKKPSMTQKVSSVSSSPSKKPSMTQKVSSTPLSSSKKPSMTQKVSSTPLSPSKRPSMTQKVSSTPLSSSKRPSMTQKVSSISSSPSKRPSMTQRSLLSHHLLPRSHQ